MKAIVQDTYGSADVLELRDVDQPQAADDEVLVRVHAAGVDRGVWHLMTGLVYPIRLAGCGLRAPKTPVPGMDLAGRRGAFFAARPSHGRRVHHGAHGRQPPREPWRGVRGGSKDRVGARRSGTTTGRSPLATGA